MVYFYSATLVQFYHAIDIADGKDVIATKKSGQTQIALTAKQMKIVEYINVNSKVTNRELQGLFKISAQAVHKELTKLVDLKVIKSVGKGRALHYILA